MSSLNLSSVPPMFWVLLLVTLSFPLVLALDKQLKRRLESSAKDKNDSLILIQSLIADNKELSNSLIALQNKTVTLLSVKDPISYQQVTAMETSTSEEKYYPQDDISEAIRRDKLAGITDENPWYDPNTHGDFSEDGS